ncbi:unnamed protein product [Moneuplotes crassus]|uniref:Uncharacterized protein n=1 Tax=Euplotes crassus TaxID=5936 RepID=A0AAD1YA16_EUPCR|nr:unnamed protein product [Moneuplotes crassus]
MDFGLELFWIFRRSGGIIVYLFFKLLKQKLNMLHPKAPHLLELRSESKYNNPSKLYKPSKLSILPKIFCYPECIPHITKTTNPTTLTTPCSLPKLLPSFHHPHSQYCNWSNTKLTI